MVTMVDVAREAGVSIKTVSRVVNDSPSVNQPLRAKVQDAIARLGYVPSPTARSLRSSRSYTIALFARPVFSAYVNTIQFAATLVCQAKGYQMRVVLLTPEDIVTPASLDDAMRRAFPFGNPEGAIVVPPLCEDPVVNQVLDARAVHICRIGPKVRFDNGVQIAIDEEAAAAELADFLIDLGHRRIGLVRGPDNQPATHARVEGYRRALAAHAIPFAPELVVDGNFEFSSGRQGAERLLGLDDPPTAIFASNDDMAAGVIAQAHLHGLRVPHDMSVVGFDDGDIAEKVQPGLTTIRQPILDYGRMAAERLIAASTAGEPVGVILDSAFVDYALVKRASHAPPPGAA